MSEMKTPGQYALDYANGATWSEIVDAIRAEALADYWLDPHRLPIQDMSSTNSKTKAKES